MSRWKNWREALPEDGDEDEDLGVQWPLGLCTPMTGVLYVIEVHRSSAVGDQYDTDVAQPNQFSRGQDLQDRKAADGDPGDAGEA